MFGKKILLTACLISIPLSSTFANATYIGADVGYARNKSQPVIILSKKSKSSASAGLVLGYKYDFTSAFSISPEIGYAYLGKYYSELFTNKTDNLNVFTLSLIPSVKLADQISANVKVGYAKQFNQQEEAGVITGLGVDYYLNPQLSVGVEYTHHFKLFEEGDRVAVGIKSYF